MADTLMRGETYGVPLAGMPASERFIIDPELIPIARMARILSATMTLGYLGSPSSIATATAIIANITTTGLFVGILTGASWAAATEAAAGVAYTAVSGGRPPVTWAAFSTDHQTSSDTQTYALLSTQASGIPFVGIYTANTAGTLLIGAPTTGLTGSIPSGANVTFTSSITFTAAG